MCLTMHGVAQHVGVVAHNESGRKSRSDVHAHGYEACIIANFLSRTQCCGLCNSVITCTVISPVAARLPQVCVGDSLVDWITHCGGQAVRLQMGSEHDPADGGRVFKLATQVVRLNGATFMPSIKCQDCGRCAHAVLATLSVPNVLNLTLLRNMSAGEAWDEAWEANQAAYKVGSMELLNAVKGRCKERGIRCTDIDGTGDTILFERA